MTNNKQGDLVKRDKFQKKLIFCHSVADLLFNKFRFYGSRKLGRLISKIILPPLSKKILCPTIYGFDLMVGPTNGQEIYSLGFYETGTLEIIKHCLKHEDVFIDVGANIGLMSLFASKYIGEKGRVFAFEPVKDTYNDLVSGVNYNNFKNIIAYNIGLGSEKKQIPIYLDRACPSMVKVSESGQSEIVNINTLDDLIHENNLSQVKFLKIDVEGFELEVLKGSVHLLSSKQAPIVCMEYISKDQKGFNGEEAITFLLGINEYEIYQLSSTSNSVSKLKLVSNIAKIRSNDNVFCMLKHHLSQLPTCIFG